MVYIDLFDATNREKGTTRPKEAGTLGYEHTDEARENVAWLTRNKMQRRLQNSIALPNLSRVARKWLGPATKP